MKSEKTDKRSRTYTMHEHPFYFGHYLNLARHNAYLIMADIHATIKLSVKVSDMVIEDQLSQSALLNLETRMPSDDKARIVSRLMAHFPFLKLLVTEKYDENSTQLTRQVLSTAFKLLNGLRNEYSHYGNREPLKWYLGNAEKEEYPLQNIYTAAVNALRPRFGYYDEKHIKPLLLTNESEIPRPNNPSQEALNQPALIFFTCCFLQRDEATRFFSRLDGFQETDSLDKRALLDTYRQVCCRLPKPKLQSGDIWLDMLNELGKCPGELYGSLATEDRKKFEVVLSPASDESEDDSEVSQVVIRKRHADRFPWFILRYFDDYEIFPKLRFQIHLAKYVDKKYNTVIHGHERERVLHRPVRVFQRWKDVNLRDFNSTEKQDETTKAQLVNFLNNDTWFNKDTNSNLLFHPDLEQLTTSYLIENNCVPFRLLGDGDNEIRYNKFPKIPLKKLAVNDETNKRLPSAIISVYDLPALFLHQHLHTPEKTEDFIKKYIDNYNRFVREFPEILKTMSLGPVLHKTKNPAYNTRAIRDERVAILEKEVLGKYNLKMRYLPQAYQDHLLSLRGDSTRYQALEKLKNKKAETRSLLKDIGFVAGKNPNMLVLPPFDRNLQYAPRAGEMATWLADDLVFLKPPLEDQKNLGKPNNDKYNVLQSMLAYFGNYKNELEDYFTELGLLSDNINKSHPFLHRIKPQNCTGILDFYGKYLTERLKYFHEAIVEIDPGYGKKPTGRRPKPGTQGDAAIEKFNYFLGIPKKTALEKNYEYVPVLLPRGLFNESNNTMLKEKYPDKFNSDMPHVNTVKALEIISDKDAQPMYNWKRHVLVHDETGKVKEQEPVEEYLLNLKARGKQAVEDTEKARIRREESFVLDREQEIRRVLCQDRILWLVAKNKLEKNMNITGDRLTLAQIENALTTEFEHVETLRLNGREMKIKARISVRRYGELRRLMRDRRLPNMLQYFKPEVELDYADLKQALELYEKRRIRLFEVIYKTEQRIFERNQDKMSKFTNPIKHYYYLNTAFEMLSEIGQAFPVKKNDLGELRNKFFHNEFPEPGKLNLAGKFENCVELVEIAFEQSEAYYNSLIKMLGLPGIELTR